MRQRKHNRTAGFSLIEVVVGIAVLGLVTAPVCASLVLSVRLNSHAQALMNARLQASGVVETLLAEGVDTDKTPVDSTTDLEGTKVTVKEVSGKPYYEVTVSCTVGDEDVEFTTHVRKDGG